MRARYTSYSGEETKRELSPYGLVVHGGRWYLAAYDHGREDLRTFRVDRLQRVEMGGAARPADEGFDAVEHVLTSFARVPWTHECVVELEEPRDVPLGERQGNRLTMRVESLDYMARVLAGLDTDFTVIKPPELEDALRRLAARISRPARTSPPAR